MLTVLGIPDFADFSYPEIKGGDKIFDNGKYESTNLDITNATGVSSALTNGTGANFSSATLNLDILYQKIAVMLEDIEEIFNQLIIMILGEKKGSNYKFEFDKEKPLTKKDKVDILMRLHNMEGFSLKHVIDEIGDVDWDEYIKQSIYEQETMELQNKIKPYASAFTSSGDNIGGRPTNNDPTNESTIKDKTNGGNNIPRASE